MNNRNGLAVKQDALNTAVWLFFPGCVCVFPVIRHSRESAAVAIHKILSCSPVLTLITSVFGEESYIWIFIVGENTGQSVVYLM